VLREGELFPRKKTIRNNSGYGAAEGVSLKRGGREENKQDYIVRSAKHIIDHNFYFVKQRGPLEIDGII
jgi:hypothetical protein